MRFNNEKSTRINGKQINNIRYADDTVLIAETLEDQQNILNKVVVANVDNGIQIKKSKLKYIC